MNAAHFKALSQKYHKKLNRKQVAFLRKLGEIVDDFEQANGVVSASVSFDQFKPGKEYFWNGEIFIPEKAPQTRQARVKG